MKDLQEEKEMSLLGHIGELRSHLIRIVIGVIIAGLIVGFNIEWIMDHIFFGPTQQNFISFRLVNHYAVELTGEPAFNIPNTFQVQQKKLFQQFNVMMSVSVFGGIVLALPYILWELWLFIRPGLLPTERKNSVGMIAAIWFFFLLGVATGYFLILPFAINFGLQYQISKKIIPFFDLSDYTSLFLQICLGMGVVFLFPIVVYILTKLDIITPQFLKTYRRHAIVLISVVAAIITPADAISMIVAALPLVLLYEVSIFISKYVAAKNKKKSLTPSSS